MPIEIVATVFMLIGAISFNEHFIAWRTLQLQRYGRDTQTRVFLLIVVVAIVADDARAVRHAAPTDRVAESLRYAAFEVVDA